MRNHRIDKQIVITGIASLTIIEVTALFQGIDGVLLASVIGVIAAAIGVVIPKEKIIKPSKYSWKIK